LSGLLLTVLSFVSIISGFAHATNTEHEALFQKGLSAYQNKQYAEARDDFQKLLDQSEDKASVSVLHNLALTALQLDQKPWALALWRKALSERPGFRPARAGRDFLESKSQMRPFERDSLSLWIHRQLESTSLFELLWLNAFLLALTGGLGIRYWSRRRQALDSEAPTPPFPTPTVLSGGLLLASLVLIGLKVQDGWTPRATVVVAKASARSLPAEDGVGLFDVSGGNEVLVRRRQDGWVQVQNAEGNSGWMKATEVYVTSGRL
jgi:hypothetical protein